MNVFKEMVCSIGKPAAYSEFLKNKKGKIFGYGMLLLTFYFLLSALIPLLSLQIRSGGIGHVVDDVLPEFEISRYGFWIEEPVYFEEGGVYIDLDSNYYFDTSAVSEFARGYETMFLMDSEKLIVKSEGQVQTLYLNSIGDTVLTKQGIMGMIPMIYTIIILFMIFYYVWIAALFFFGALLVSLVGLIFSSALKTRLTFGQVYILALYGRTLPLLVKGVLKLIGVSIPFFWVINFGITLVYMFLAMKKVAEQNELQMQSAYQYQSGNTMQGYGAQDYSSQSYGSQDYSSQNYGYGSSQDEQNPHQRF